MQKDSMDFFMGALSPEGGFRGYFSHLNKQPDLWLYLIKAGPGCGKSTLMKRLADKSTAPVERIHCSSDPYGLDGVVFPTKNAAVLDATAPHALEPTYPEAKQSSIDLFCALNSDFIKQNRHQIIALFDRCSALQKQANRCISTAAVLLEEEQSIANSALLTEKLTGYTLRLAKRLLPNTGRQGKEHLRLLSAVTPQGLICWNNSVSAAADHIVVFQDEFGAAAAKAIQILRNKALQAGYEMYTCICPLSRQETAEHLLIPQLRLAFVTSNHYHPMDFETHQTIHCTRFLHKETLSGFKNRLRLIRHMVDELLAETSAFQKQAKANHDELEQFYIQAADFHTIDNITQQIGEKIGL